MPEFCNLNDYCHDILYSFTSLPPYLDIIYIGWVHLFNFFPAEISFLFMDSVFLKTSDFNSTFMTRKQTMILLILLI